MDTNPSGIFHEVTVIFSPALCTECSEVQVLQR